MIDGIAATPGATTGWYWTKTKRSIDYAIPWFAAQPDNGGGNEQCLSILKRNGAAGFNDQACSATYYSFMCQTKKKS